MGTKSSRPVDAAATRAPAITEKEILTLCEDGDLLFMREHVVHAKLRVAIDQQVAQDITRFQQGEFPNTRVTQLQAWTSCGLLLRLSGVLHLLEVTLSGLQLVPFQERVADRTYRRDVYAIRRLQHVRTEQMSETLRQLTFELSQALPLCLEEAPSPSSLPPTVSPSQPPSRQIPQHPTPSTESLISIRDALSKHQTLHSILRRALPLFHHSYASTIVTPPLQLDEAPAQLATAVVVAVYERLAFIAELDTSSSSTPFRLLPSSLTSKTDSSSRCIEFTPTNALGAELRLA